MRLLLDTHIALWAVTDDPKLSRQARILINNQSNTMAVSVISLWEVAIKQMMSARRKAADPLPLTVEEAAIAFSEAGFDILNLTAKHVGALAALAPLHADPFDRILVAQALSEGMRLLTNDHRLPAYSDTVIAN